MKVYEMNLKDIINGLEFVNCKYESRIIGNDEDRTLYLKNITFEQYNDLINFDLEKINSNVSDLNLSEVKSIDIINDYIIPTVNKLRKRFELYGF